MNISELKKILNKIKILKSKKNFVNHSLSELRGLPSFNALMELKFYNKPFFMLNIANDDAVVLKYLWKNKYENLSLSIWFDLTRDDGIFFDIGSHTGIYSIIGNLEKSVNNIISIEAFYMNYARLLSNLKINNISIKNAYLAAASNLDGVGKFNIPTNFSYHTSGGQLSDQGSLSVPLIKVDNFKSDKAIKAIKIDTEGHENKVLEGAKLTLENHKPDIILEINKKSFDLCVKLLKPLNYSFYFIDENNNNLEEIYNYNENLKRQEGSNCFATVNSKTSLFLKKYL